MWSYFTQTIFWFKQWIFTKASALARVLRKHLELSILQAKVKITLISYLVSSLEMWFVIVTIRKKFDFMLDFIARLTKQRAIAAAEKSIKLCSCECLLDVSFSDDDDGNRRRNELSLTRTTVVLVMRLKIEFFETFVWCHKLNMRW